MSTTKLLQEELQKLKDFQRSENEITFSLGQIELRKVFLEKDKKKSPKPISITPPRPRKNR